MSSPNVYKPSRMLDGKTALIRERSFTRWMSRDLLQASIDFCKNIGLHAIYVEHAPKTGFRALLWHTPEKALIEVRSGRPWQNFEDIDLRNAGQKRRLLSLHIDERENYSAVWISEEHYETAKAMLAFYGITPAERKL